MKIDKLKRDKIITISMSGRLDVDGSEEMNNYLADLDNNHEYEALILDMAQTNYLSSAGLRTLVSLSKNMHKNHKRMALCNLQKFCMEVIKVTGFQNIFNIFYSLPEAEKYCSQPHKSDTADGTEISSDNTQMETDGGIYQFTALPSHSAALAVSGELVDILHSHLNNALVTGHKFKDMQYSLGFGALGNIPSEYMETLGEMLTVNGAMYWHNSQSGSSDYLIPADEAAGNVLIQSGFDVALSGGFSEFIRFSSTDKTGTPLEQIYQDLLRLAGTRKHAFRGVLWCSMISYAGAVCGRNLTKAPLNEHHPSNGKTINHPSNIEEWFNTDLLPEHRDCTCMISGIAIDLMRDLSDYSEPLLERIFYLNPAMLGGKEFLSRSHAAIFKDATYKHDAPDFTEECRRISADSLLERCCELQDKTRIKNALIALAYIDNLETPAQLDTMFARTLDYKLNRDNLLRHTYHLDEKEGQ
jgi:anti-anti-sigma factor